MKIIFSNLKKIKEIIRIHRFNSAEINNTYYYVVYNLKENNFDEKSIHEILRLE